MLRALSIPFFVTLSLVASRANAEEQAPTLPYDHYAEPAEPSPKLTPTKSEKPFTPEKTYESYGLPMAFIDAGAFVLLGATFANTKNMVVANTTLAHSLAIYGVVPPIIHLVNGEPLRGFASFGLRLGAPLVGALAAQMLAIFLVGVKEGLTSSRGDDPDATPALAGATLGALGAAAIDDYFLARRYPK